MKIEIQEEWYSVEDCLANPNKLYIFGDNTLRVGKGGQAQIRDIDNCFGIATKRAPGSKDIDYFNDTIDDHNVLLMDLKDLKKIIVGDVKTSFDTVVFPADGLGTGLSQMPQRSPNLYKMMNSFLSDLIGTKYPKG